MSDSDSPILIEEVRLGLFRIYWELDFSMWLNKNIYEKRFELCDSKKGRCFYLNFELQSVAIAAKNKPYYYKIKIEDLLCTNNDGNYSENDETNPQEPQSNKRQKLERASPAYIWLDGHASSTNELPLLESTDHNGIWEVAVTTTVTQAYIVIWMDFGTSELKEKQVINGLVEMFNNQTQCDVHFQFNDGQSIGSHVVILSAGSPVFATMFQSDFIESKSRKVTIVDVEIDVFKQLLIFLYTGNAPRLKEESITRILFELADKYGAVTSSMADKPKQEHILFLFLFSGAVTLKEQCGDVLLTQIDIENVIDMLVWAHFHSMENLFEVAMKFLVKNFRKLCIQPEWMELMKNHPDLCLLANQQIAELLPKTESEDSGSDEY